MSELSFAVLGARAEPYAAVPTLMLRVEITSTSAAPVHALVLRAQIMIQPNQRRYEPAEEQRLTELFGPTPQWGDTLRPFLWSNVSLTLPRFDGRTEVDLPIVCTYDFEIAAVKYMHSLGDGEIPIVLLFSGTVFGAGVGAGMTGGMSAMPVSWSEEASYRLPVAVWRTMMDQYFPGTGWLRLSHETLDRLQRFKVARTLTSWDDTFERLLKEAGEDG